MRHIETLTERKRQLFWPLVAANLTVAARETYVPQTDEIAQPRKLRAYNEMLHRVCSQIVAIHTGLADGFPDEELVRLLLDLAEKSGNGDGLEWAMEDALKKSVATA